MLYKYIYIGELMGYIYIYKYNSQKLQFAAYGQFVLFVSRSNNVSFYFIYNVIEENILLFFLWTSYY